MHGIIHSRAKVEATNPQNKCVRLNMANELENIISKLDHQYLNDLQPFIENNLLQKIFQNIFIKNYQKILILITLKSVKLSCGKQAVSCNIFKLGYKDIMSTNKSK